MTIKGKSNHYNVKFLKGYGHSISVKNSKIILKDNYDSFSEPTQEEWFVKNMPYEKIVLQGKGYISTETLSLLSQNNRNVILLDNHGNPELFNRDFIVKQAQKVLIFSLFVFRFFLVFS